LALQYNDRIAIKEVPDYRDTPVGWSISDRSIVSNAMYCSAVMDFGAMGVDIINPVLNITSVAPQSRNSTLQATRRFKRDCLIALSFRQVKQGSQDAFHVLAYTVMETLIGDELFHVADDRRCLLHKTKVDIPGRYLYEGQQEGRCSHVIIIAMGLVLSPVH
jgi:hypothetical protein